MHWKYRCIRVKSFGRQSQKEIEHFKDLGVDDRILEWILKK
jgi:hypothetical protein